MTKLQRIRKINQNNSSLTQTTVRKYINKHYSKNLPHTEELSPVYFETNEELEYIIMMMKKTSKLLLTKDYILDYFTAYLPSKNRVDKDIILEYNNRKYQEKKLDKIRENIEIELESLKEAKPIEDDLVESYEEVHRVEQYFNYREHECSNAGIFCDNFTYDDYLIEKKLNIKYDKDTFKNKDQRYKYWCKFYGLDENYPKSMNLLGLIVSKFLKNLNKDVGMEKPYTYGY